MNDLYIDNERISSAQNIIASVLSVITERIPVTKDLSLCNGLSGVAMLCSMRRADSTRLGATLETLLDKILDRCADGDFMDVRFYSGLPGVGFGLQYCLKGEPTAGELSDLDELVRRLLSVSSWPGHFDLISGLVGLGAYSLASRGADREQLFGLCLSHLQQSATPTASGVVWQTKPTFRGYESRGLPESQPNFNLGLAHGNAGVVGLLAWAVKEGVCVEKASKLLARATLGLLSLRHQSKERCSCFGYVAGDGVDSRVGWCYGDLGNALMLVRAGNVLSSTSVMSQGLEIARNVLKREKRSMILLDHGLCHGTAGVGLLMTALHRETGERAFLDSARAHYAEVIDAGVGNLDNLMTLNDDGSRSLEIGLLTGVGGIAMALTDAMKVSSDGWTKWMLI